MGSEQPATYYDQIYADPCFSKPWNRWENDKRTTLWQAAANLVPDHSNIIDLGCGCGQFPQALLIANKIKSYAGYDFSNGAIIRAKALWDSYWPKYDHVNFWVYDLNKWTGIGDTIKYCADCVYTLIEVLEHIENDGNVLNMIPSGATVVISVPSFDDDGHVRHFLEPGSIIKRYGHIVDFKEETGNFVRIAKGKWHLCRGIKI